MVHHSLNPHPLPSRFMRVVVPPSAANAHKGWAQRNCPPTGGRLSAGPTCKLAKQAASCQKKFILLDTIVCYMFVV